MDEPKIHPTPVEVWRQDALTQVSYIRSYSRTARPILANLEALPVHFVEISELLCSIESTALVVKWLIENGARSPLESRS